MLLSLLNLFTAPTPDSCAPQSVLDKRITQEVTSGKAEGAGHNVVALGIAGHFSLKRVNDKGDDFMLPTVVWGSCGQGGAGG